MSLASGAATGNGDPSLPTATSILLAPPVRQHGDIIRWWWFDDAKGTAITDAMGVIPAQLKGGADWSPNGKFGASVGFDAEGDQIELGADPGLSTANSFSISFWFKRTTDSFSWSGNNVNNVMLSLRGSTRSSIEIGTEGGNLETYLSTESKSEQIATPPA